MHSNAKFYLKICIFFYISDHFLIANSKHQNVQIHQQTSTMLMTQTTKNQLVPILVGQAVLQTIGMSDYSLLHNITQTILLMPLLKELFLLLNQFITNNLSKTIWQFDPKVSRDKSCGQLFCLWSWCIALDNKCSSPRDFYLLTFVWPFILRKLMQFRLDLEINVNSSSLEFSVGVKLTKTVIRRVKSS